MTWRRRGAGYPSSAEPVTELPRVHPGPGPGWRAPRDGGYRPEVSTPEPTVGPDGPSGASSASRPHPAANAWPDDAVTVTYAELRRLVALHLDLAWQGMPRTEPWTWLRLRAGAVRDGEAPLLLSEVMGP